MKLDKLAKQLRRDIAANPKKAAALGLMGLVALYFWAPLVWRWVSPEGGKKTPTASALILTDDPEQPNVQAKRRAGKFRWEKVRPLIGNDPQMASAAFDVNWTDPFAGHGVAPQTKSSAGPTAGGTQPKVAVELDPQQAGILLTSVMIGSQRRSATINGDTYYEGGVISLGSDGQSIVEFRVVRIASQGVELERNGKKYALLLARPGLGKGDRIQRTGPQRKN